MKRSSRESVSHILTISIVSYKPLFDRIENPILDMNLKFKLGMDYNALRNKILNNNAEVLVNKDGFNISVSNSDITGILLDADQITQFKDTLTNWITLIIPDTEGLLKVQGIVSQANEDIKAERDKIIQHLQKHFKIKSLITSTSLSDIKPKNADIITDQLKSPIVTEPTSPSNTLMKKTNRSALVNAFLKKSDPDTSLRKPMRTSLSDTIIEVTDMTSHDILMNITIKFKEQSDSKDPKKQPSTKNRPTFALARLFRKPKFRRENEPKGITEKKKADPNPTVTHESQTILSSCSDKLIHWCSESDFTLVKTPDKLTISLINNEIICIEGKQILTNSVSKFALDTILKILKLIPNMESAQISPTVDEQRVYDFFRGNLGDDFEKIESESQISKYA